MTPSTLLRIAAVVALLQFAGHGALFLRAKPTHGPAEVAVVTAMKQNRFNFGGSTRSYWDMYFGYGMEAAAVCLLEAILLWQLASIIRVAPGLIRPLIALVLIANLAHIVLVVRYFFLVPLVPDVVISALLTLVLASSVPANSDAASRSVACRNAPESAYLAELTG
jgi:hypothetical protein